MTVDMYNQSAFLVIKIAYMYYIENYSQNEIAKALQISVTTVSRMLKKAKQERIVEFVIRDPYVKSVYLIATRDLRISGCNFFYLKIKGLCDFLRKRF